MSQTVLSRWLGVGEQRSFCVNGRGGESAGFACGCYFEQESETAEYRTHQCAEHAAVEAVEAK